MHATVGHGPCGASCVIFFGILRTYNETRIGSRATTDSHTHTFLPQYAQMLTKVRAMAARHGAAVDHGGAWWQHAEGKRLPTAAKAKLKMHENKNQNENKNKNKKLKTKPIKIKWNRRKSEKIANGFVACEAAKRQMQTIGTGMVRRQRLIAAAHRHTHTHTYIAPKAPSPPPCVHMYALSRELIHPSTRSTSFGIWSANSSITDFDFFTLFASEMNSMRNNQYAAATATTTKTTVALQPKPPHSQAASSYRSVGCGNHRSLSGSRSHNNSNNSESCRQKRRIAFT